MQNGSQVIFTSIFSRHVCMCLCVCSSYRLPLSKPAIYSLIFHFNVSFLVHAKIAPSSCSASDRYMSGLERFPCSFTWRSSIFNMSIFTGLPMTMSAPAARYSMTSSTRTLPVTPTTRCANPPARSLRTASTPHWTVGKNTHATQVGTKKGGNKYVP